jgi:hypothetical protein
MGTREVSIIRSSVHNSELRYAVRREKRRKVKVKGRERGRGEEEKELNHNTAPIQSPKSP